MQIRYPTPAATAVAVICVLLIFRAAPEQSSVELRADRYSVVVQRVYDGDNFETAKGQKIRLLGIDAPEVAHFDQAAEPYGDQSSEWLSSRILHRTVFIEEGITPLDRYGRTLAWVYLDDESLVNELLLNTGNARLLTRFGLPVNLEPRLRAAEGIARDGRLGLWASD